MMLFGFQRAGAAAPTKRFSRFLSPSLSSSFSTIRRPGLLQQISSPLPTIAKRGFSAQAIPLTEQISHAVRSNKTSAMFAAVGLGGLALATISALSTSSDRAVERAGYAEYTQMSSDPFYEETVMSRLHSTYGYLMGSVGITGATATALWRSGTTARMMRASPMALGIGSMVLGIGSMIATQSIPYDNTIPKHLAWTAFAASQALMIAPLGALGGPIIYKAAVSTGILVASLSLAGVVAPSEKVMKMQTPLMCGLGLCFAAGIGGMFFPASALLHNVWMYGGLAVFSGLMVYDTDRITTAAQEAPYFDPINQQISIYLNALNLFVRMAMLMANGNRRK